MSTNVRHLFIMFRVFVLLLIIKSTHIKERLSVNLITTQLEIYWKQVYRQNPKQNKRNTKNAKFFHSLN